MKDSSLNRKSGKGEHFDLRGRLFAHYRATQGAIASGHSYSDIRSVWPYFEANYRAVVEALPRTVAILEVGCGQGSLLAWLRTLGFENLKGVDASPGDVTFAEGHLGEGVVCLSEGRRFLEEHPGTFDCILMKAILEHQPKQELLPMILEAAGALRPYGILLVDVPNMDWFFATHERYMDLTHEVGFTRESLQTLLSLCFERVEVRGSLPSERSRVYLWSRKLMIRILRSVYFLLGEGASNVLFESRSIVAVALSPRVR